MTAGRSESGLEGLVARAQAGDDRAFETLFAQVYPVLQSSAAGLGCGARIADEAVAETCLVLGASLHTYQTRGSGSFLAWLRKVLHHKILEVLRKERPSRGTLPLFSQTDDGSSVSREPADQNGQTPEVDALRKETIERVRGCVNQLPATQREAIERYELHNHDDLTIEEVADQLKVPVPTFKSRLSTARKNLRECLAREDL
jgi:RNA polymerase sigma-70 factor (ECF subfamily)